MNHKNDQSRHHQYGKYSLLPGHYFPYGAIARGDGVSFSTHSSRATSCTLVLFEKGALEPFVEIPFPPEFTVGHVFSMTVRNLDAENIEYGYRMDGPNLAPGDQFDEKNILLDPYAKAVSGQEVWGVPGYDGSAFRHRSRVLVDHFEWENDLPLRRPVTDLVIYEMHVRSFTRHPSSNVNNPGTYAGLQEKIDYLKELGVNCVELMPVFEFDELENARSNPLTDTPLVNYWGYSTVGFFAPKAGYAATIGKEVVELKALIKELHAHGIEVILDVVFNHTAEGDERGPTISFKGIDNKVYYLLTPDGHYYNFSGCGNTLNCNHPIVRGMIFDCLRYWTFEYHVDGFRFDLASILGRDMRGAPLPNPPLVEFLTHDPILSHLKLIAEAWDAAGLYQVGSFPSYQRWAEWNGRYRDAIRRFLRGDKGLVSAISECLQGSPGLYTHSGRSASASVNFITCHDGFTLHDLFAYNEKHNEANGEGNMDGTNDSASWNCGVEGPTDDPQVLTIRKRQIRNAVTILMLSRGVPMIYCGDEMGRTQDGNNNNYCHDNELSWLDWSLLQRNGDIFRFFKNIIAFRHAHPVLRSTEHYHNADYLDTGYPDISWHGVKAWEADWSHHSHTLAFLICGEYAGARDSKHGSGGMEQGGGNDDFIYAALNMHSEPHTFELPCISDQANWHLAVDTGRSSPEDSCAPDTEQLLEDQNEVCLEPRSVVVLVGR